MEYFEDDKTIYFAKLKDKAILPSKEEENAGYDIYACFEDDYIEIPPHSTKLIPTGIAWASSPKYYMQIEERSSTGTKGIKKSAGVIDSGYRGEIKIAITNINPYSLIFSNIEEDKLHAKFILPKNCLVYSTKKAIAQGIIHKVRKMKIVEIDKEELLKIPSSRGDKGWGSTNKG